MAVQVRAKHSTASAASTTINDQPEQLLQFQDLPEAITAGDTMDEALLHAQEVLSLCRRLAPR